MKAHKVYQSLQKQVEEAERRYEAQRWDALQKAVERLQDVHIQAGGRLSTQLGSMWLARITFGSAGPARCNARSNGACLDAAWHAVKRRREILHAVSGAAVKLKQKLQTRRLEAVLGAEDVSLLQRLGRVGDLICMADRGLRRRRSRRRRVRWMTTWWAKRGQKPMLR